MDTKFKNIISLQFTIILALFLALFAWNAQQHFSIADLKNQISKQPRNPQRPTPPAKIEMDKLLENALTYGPKDAKIKIVKFNSFSCGYCTKASKVVHQLIEKYPNSIQFVYKHFNRVQIDQLTAQSLECAAEKGSFWKMYNALFSKRISSLEDIYSVATSIGLSENEMKTCITSQKFLPKTTKETELAQKISINGTPAFVINGKLYPGYRPFESFDKIIQDLL